MLYIYMLYVIYNILVCYIYFHHCKDEIKRLEETRKIQYLKMKINYYKIQDMDAKREFIKESYIDVPWFTEAIKILIDAHFSAAASTWC